MASLSPAGSRTSRKAADRVGRVEVGVAGKAALGIRGIRMPAVSTWQIAKVVWCGMRKASVHAAARRLHRAGTRIFQDGLWRQVVQSFLRRVMSMTRQTGVRRKCAIRQPRRCAQAKVQELAAECRQPCRPHSPARQLQEPCARMPHSWPARAKPDASTLEGAVPRVSTHRRAFASGPARTYYSPTGRSMIDHDPQRQRPHATGSQRRP